MEDEIQRPYSNAELAPLENYLEQTNLTSLKKLIVEKTIQKILSVSRYNDNNMNLEGSWIDNNMNIDVETWFDKIKIKSLVFD